MMKNLRWGLAIALTVAALSAHAGTTSYFVYDESGHVIGEYDANGNAIQEHVYLGDRPVAVVQGGSSSGGTVDYVTTDQLNTPRVITDSSQAVLWTWNSDPFGNGQPTGSLTYDLRFPGQQYDSETGHDYNINRDYDSNSGRYIESDPLGLKGGMNTYVYVDDSPLDDWDQLGLAPGGPYHPPAGVSLRCTSDDSCAMMDGKMFILMQMIVSHMWWDWINPPPRGGGRHAQEIADLWRAFANCQALHAQYCQSCPPRAPGSPMPIPGAAPPPPVTPNQFIPIP